MLEGLYRVKGKPKRDLRAWLASQKYQATQDNVTGDFELVIYDEADLLGGCAADVNRLSSAAIESLLVSEVCADLPSHQGWAFIKVYYAAFFAAGAILRMLGHGVVRIDSSQATAIKQVLRIQGASNAQVSPGAYHVVCALKKHLVFLRPQSQKGGFHEAHWEVFQSALRNARDAILLRGAPPTSQLVANQISELDALLSRDNSSSGQWLSRVRNKLNYRHERGLWYPYDNCPLTRKQFECERDQWLEDPMTFELVLSDPTELRAFVRCCCCIVSCCRVMLEDIANRCAVGSSFVSSGPLFLLHEYG
jgi:hypothetical protein